MSAGRERRLALLVVIAISLAGADRGASASSAPIAATASVEAGGATPSTDSVAEGLTGAEGSDDPSDASTVTAVTAALGGAPPSTASPAASVAAPAGQPARTSTPEDSEERVKLVATLQALDTSAQKIWLVTGMGLALRVLQAEVAPTCQIKVSGEAARLGDLKPGNVVRAECLSSDGKLVAVVIETVPTPAEGRPR